MKSVYDIELLDPQGQAHSLSAVEVSSICGPIERTSVPQHILEEFHHLPLADEYSNEFNLRLQILVGLDYFWSFIDNTLSHRVGNIVG